MSYRHFVQQVQSKSGLGGEQIEPAIAAALSVLGERLSSVDAKAVAEQLPPELRRHLCDRARTARPVATSSGSEAFLQRLCDQSGVSREQIQAICRVLAETLDEQGRAQLRIQPLTALFRTAEPESLN